MTTEQKYNAVKAHLKKAVNCAVFVRPPEAILPYVNTLLAVLEMIWGCHKGHMFLHTEDSSPWGVEIHAIYEGLCKGGSDETERN